MTELCPFNVHAPKWHMAYIVPPMDTLTLIYKLILKSISPPSVTLHLPNSLLLHYPTNLPETFTIDVNKDFANNLGRFLI